MKDVEKGGIPSERLKTEFRKRRNHNLQTEDISRVKKNKKQNILEWDKKRS